MNSFLTESDDDEDKNQENIYPIEPVSPPLSNDNQQADQYDDMFKCCEVLDESLYKIDGPPAINAPVFSQNNNPFNNNYDDFDNFNIGDAYLLLSLSQKQHHMVVSNDYVY